MPSIPGRAIPGRARTRSRRPRSPFAVLPTAWTAIGVSATVAATRPSAVLAARMAGVRRRCAALRRGREDGLTTVEVAIITAVLLGLATALVVAITLVVNRNTAKIK